MEKARIDMQSVFTNNNNPVNKIVVSVAVFIVVAFLFLAYSSDSLGKFTQSVSNVGFIPVEKDSYGSLCSPNFNYGKETSVLVVSDPDYCKFGGSSGDREAFIRFDLSKMPKDFKSATLFLRSDEANGIFQIFPLNSEWDENAVNWNGPDFKSYWDSQGTGENDYVSSQSVQFENRGSKTYVSVDITKIANYWQSNKNYGLVIKALDGSMSFYSKESDFPGFIIIK